MTLEFHPVRVAIGRVPNGTGRRNGDHARPAAETVTSHTAPASPAEKPRVVHTPSIDIREDAEGLILEADLPGAAEDAVEIRLEDNVLHLRATVAPAAAEPAAWLHREFHPGDFQRSFILSDEFDRDRISAEMRQGVLRIQLPRAERAKARRIEIKSS